MFLVTGGAGFIGSNLVAELAQQGHSVVVSDWLEKGDKWKNLAKHELEDMVTPGNLSAFLAKRGRGLRAVFHMGAISATTETDGDKLMEYNFRLSCNLWNFCQHGGQRRDFVYVGDCIAVMLWLYQRRNCSGFFNVGTGKANSFLDLARAVFSSLKLPENIEFIPTPDAIREKYQYHTQAKMIKLQQAGYDRAFTPLEEGVKCYVQRYLNQNKAYR